MDPICHFPKFSLVDQSCDLNQSWALFQCIMTMKSCCSRKGGCAVFNDIQSKGKLCTEAVWLGVLRTSQSIHVNKTLPHIRRSSWSKAEGFLQMTSRGFLVIPLQFNTEKNSDLKTVSILEKKVPFFEEIRWQNGIFLRFIMTSSELAGLKTGGKKPCARGCALIFY